MEPPGPPAGGRHDEDEDGGDVEARNTTPLPRTIGGSQHTGGGGASSSSSQSSSQSSMETESNRSLLLGWGVDPNGSSVSEASGNLFSPPSNNDHREPAEKKRVGSLLVKWGQRHSSAGESTLAAQGDESDDVGIDRGDDSLIVKFRRRGSDVTLEDILKAAGADEAPDPLSPSREAKASPLEEDAKAEATADGERTGDDNCPVERSGTLRPEPAKTKKQLKKRSSLIVKFGRGRGGVGGRRGSGVSEMSQSFSDCGDEHSVEGFSVSATPRSMGGNGATPRGGGYDAAAGRQQMSAEGEPLCEAQA